MRHFIPGILIFGTVLFLGSMKPAVGAGSATRVLQEPDAGQGAQLFESACATCHDTTGVTDYPGIYTERDYRDLVINMIGYGAALNDSQAEIVIAYLTATYGREDTDPQPSEEVDPAPAAQGDDLAHGEELFFSTCTTCHDVYGITDYPGIYNETEFRDMIGRMLDYGAPLNGEQAEAVLRYLVATYGKK